MAFDVKSIAKDNAKLILSVIGITIFAVLSASNLDSGSSFTALDSTSSLEDNEKEQKEVEYYGDATPVSNGNANKYAVSPAMKLEDDVDYRAEIVTDKGDIKIDLFEEEAPMNVNNFVFLAENQFYTGTSFHRVMKDYVIQGGDPLGNGSGGPGYYVDDEITDREFEPFLIAMASAEEDANGSQFFITTRNISRDNMETYLQDRYTIIGEVVDGFDVIDNIELERVDENKMPYDPIVITNIKIYEGSSPFDL